jgi:hypothetical protein
MPASPNESCGACRYWRKHGAHQPISSREHAEYGGRCHRHPPSMDGWPVTLEADWCGEFEWLRGTDASER